MFDFSATSRLNDGGITPFYSPTIKQSCRFSDDDSAYLHWTPAGAGTEETFTFSVWLKRCNLSSIMQIFNAAAGNELQFTAANKLQFTTASCTLLTTQIFRDVTDWMHVLLAVDTTQGTAANRVKIYINGTQITAFDTETYPNLNEVTEFGKAAIHHIASNEGGTEEFDGYLAEFQYTDGLQGINTSFGKLNYGIWITKKYTGSYGINGFHQDYAVAPGTGNGAGTDVSGNANHFTDSGLAANDKVLDSPTNNYPTLNVTHHLSTATLANGNLDCSGVENEYGTIIIPPTGKWGWKITVSENGSFGLEDIDANEKVAADVSGEVVEMLVDMDAVTLKKKVNGGGLETIEASLNKTFEWYPYFKAACSVDFGQLGYFPSEPGYKSLCSNNISTPTIKDSSTGFDVVLYEGNATVRDITDLSFQPDLVWIKNRDAADEHKLIDSVRGVTKELSSDSTAIEGTDANGLTAFLSNGFSLGTGAAGYNDNAESFVAWCFKMGKKFGFDIQTYEGTGIAHAINHNLGGIPELITVKNLESVYGWYSYHHHMLTKTNPEDFYGVMDTAATWLDNVVLWNDTAPTNTQFTVGTYEGSNGNLKDYVAYLWRSIPGFSKVFSYTGNGNADGPFVYCGFRPRYILQFNAQVGYGWVLWDTKRNTYNLVENYLSADSPIVESTYTGITLDILSNGFKFRGAHPAVNQAATLFGGIAYAEQPGKYSNAR